MLSMATRCLHHDTVAATLPWYLLKQTEKIHDVLRADFVPVGHQSVCGEMQAST